MGWNEMEKPLSGSPLHLPTPRQAVRVSALATSRAFEPNASIVLVGTRGCGKTSLGYIAARALGRRLVEADDEFERKTGLSRAQFLKNNGQNAEEYRLQERKVMETMLANNERDAVIVCGLGSIESHGQMLLKRFANTHPVIHILRETEYFREWLRVPKESNLMQRLEQSDRRHRTCSNFEYYNLFDGGSEPGIADGRISRDEVLKPGQCSPRYAAALQRAQQDLIRFITLIMGFPDPTLRSLRSKLATAASTNRVYSYALSVEFSQIGSGKIDVTELECGADVVELVVNASDVAGQSVTADSPWITTLSKQIATLRRKVSAPIIYHVDRNSFRQAFDERQLNEVYLELLHLGLRMGVEFLTVDIDLDEQLARELRLTKGITTIIGDHFDTGPSQQTWDDPRKLEKYQRARDLGCDIIRMRKFASSDEDNIAIRRLTNKLASLPGAHPPFISYNVGRLGRASMCYNCVLTSVTHPSLRGSNGRKDHQALLTIQEASKMTYDLGLLDPLHFCLFGASILYSLSPAMHNAAYQASGLPHEYSLQQSPRVQDLDSILRGPSFGGASISLPYKIDVLRLVDSLSIEATAIGGVNTIIPLRSSMSPKNGALATESSKILGWHGENTDWLGMTACIRRNLSPANMIRPRTSSLVIGAGGMARAAVYTLIRLDVPNIFIYNRTTTRAEELADHFMTSAPTVKKDTPSANARNVKHRVAVLKFMNDPWPSGFDQPTIIISCVPAHSINGSPAPNITLPIPWLQSVNGGVILEVSLHIYDMDLFD
jgi:shikimate 5-dehydrogenase/shikimate kinase